MIDFFALPSGQIAAMVRCDFCEERIINRQRGVALLTNLTAIRHVRAVTLHTRCERRWRQQHGSSDRWQRAPIPVMLFRRREAPARQVADFFRKVELRACGSSSVSVWPLISA